MEIRKVTEKFTSRLTRFFKGDILIITEKELLIVDNGLVCASSFVCDKMKLSDFNIDDTTSIFFNKLGI